LLEFFKLKSQEYKFTFNLSAGLSYIMPIYSVKTSNIQYLTPQICTNSCASKHVHVSQPKHLLPVTANTHLPIQICVNRTDK